MPPGANFNEAMLAVDEAMYEAKNNGKNQVALGTIKKTG
jgi:PleD family two-component response regulator